MSTMNDHLSAPGLASAVVAASSGSVAFFANTLPYVQWFAGVAAFLAGVAAVASVFKHWNDKR